MYYSLSIPYTSKNATVWHPTSSHGPFNVLSRGCFRTESEAHAWADRNIPGHEYSLTQHNRLRTSYGDLGEFHIWLDCECIRVERDLVSALMFCAEVNAELGV